MASVSSLVAEAIAGGWDFVVMDEDWTDDVKRMVEGAGYEVERNEPWEAYYCKSPEWLKAEGGLPC